MGPQGQKWTRTKVKMCGPQGQKSLGLARVTRGGLSGRWAPWHGLGIYLKARQERMLSAAACCLAQVLPKLSKGYL